MATKHIADKVLMLLVGCVEVLLSLRTILIYDALYSWASRRKTETHSRGWGLQASPTGALAMLTANCSCVLPCRE